MTRILPPPPATAGRRRLLRLAAAGLTLAVLPTPGRAADPAPAPGAGAAGPLAPPPPVRFDVIALGAAVGRHTVTFSQAGDAFTALTRIDIDARVLGVRLFRYRQETRESWRQGRLQAFTSEGNDDGQDFRTAGQAGEGGFVVDGRTGRVVAPADVMLATYWTPLMLTRAEVINPKRGNLKAQTVRPDGEATVSLGGETRSARRYAITGVLDGTILYDAAGRWVGASFDRKGAAIEYRLAG
jgi:hypothetical protein